MVEARHAVGGCWLEAIRRTDAIDQQDFRTGRRATGWIVSSACATRRKRSPAPDCRVLDHAAKPKRQVLSAPDIAPLAEARTSGTKRRADTSATGRSQAVNFTRFGEQRSQEWYEQWDQPQRVAVNGGGATTLHLRRLCEGHEKITATTTAASVSGVRGCAIGGTR